MPRTTFAPWKRGAIAACLLLAVLLGAAPARAETDTIQIEVRLWTTPARAARGDIVSYEILVDNNGGEGANRVRVTLPFSGHMSVVRTEFDHETTWISEVSQDRLTVMFGRLNGGQDRRAKIFFQIGPDAPDGTQVRVRATARFEKDGGSRVHSNYTTLTIGGEAASTAPEASVTPAAVARGGNLAFSVRNYFPAEKLFTWINAPGGVLKSDLTGVTDGEGVATLRLDTERLRPGSYSLVILGDSSRIELVVPFVVQ
jgi:uncharacterized repeat protein (TIGR01451 family)